MRLVIDANILVAAFLKAATTRNLLLDPRLQLYAPEDLLKEGHKVLKDRLAKKWAAIPDFDFDQIFSFLTGHISILSQKDYFSFMKNVLKIAPHQEDAPYLACALHLNIPLWSNDGGLRDQKEVKVFSTSELLMELRRIKSQ